MTTFAFAAKANGQLGVDSVNGGAPTDVTQGVTLARASGPFNVASGFTPDANPTLTSEVAP